MKIAMIASEANPIAKTGGLADVVYSLSKEFAKKGQDVIIVMPYYNTIKGKIKDELVASYEVFMSWRVAKADVYKTRIDGITYYLIANSQYFDRGHLYGDNDDGERFAFFTMAAKELFKHIKFSPDIIHVHDWQPGMLPCVIKCEYPIRKEFEKTKFVLTIHNPAFQGLCSQSILPEFYNLSENLFYDGTVRFNGQVSTLKSAIMFADKITTVSPSHRDELLNEETSMGLANIIRLREWDFCGFLNGIDEGEFDPKNDPFIAEKYDENNVLEAKKINRKDLLDTFHLKDNGKPIFGLVSRLTWQKGTEILLPTLYELAKNGNNIIVLGSGEYNVEQGLEILRGNFSENVGIYIGYNNEIAHKVYAGSDLFLMPSLFEPCGIGQMIAEKYGTPPIVRRTGGLRDSVISYDNNNPNSANGFGFDEFSVKAFVNTCNWVIDVYDNKDVFNKIVKNAITTNNSWEKSCNLYLGLYKEITGR